MASWSKPVQEEDGQRAEYLKDEHTLPDRSCRLCKAIAKEHDISMELWEKLRSREIVGTFFTPRIHVEMNSPPSAKHMLSPDTSELFSHIDVQYGKDLSNWSWSQIELSMKLLFLREIKPQLLRSLRRMKLQDKELYQTMALRAERGDLVISWLSSALVPGLFKSKVQYSTTAPGRLQLIATKENWPDIAKEAMRERCTGELTLKILMDESLAFNDVIDRIVDGFEDTNMPSLIHEDPTQEQEPNEPRVPAHTPLKCRSQSVGCAWMIELRKKVGPLAIELAQWLIDHLKPF